MINRLKRWLFWWLLIAGLIIVCYFATQVSEIPDYRGGEALVSYSPDHRYKMSRIYPIQDYDRGTRVFFLLSAWPSKKPLAIYLIPMDWIYGFSDIWLHKNDLCLSKYPCTSYMVTTLTEDFPNIRLPPDRWNRLLALVFFKLHPWQDVPLKEQPM